MNLKVNGKRYEVPAEPDRPLLWILRDELGLTGTKYACGAGLCGSCEVHLDGKLARSCVTLLSECQGKEVRTIEGLAGADGALHPVQQAFLEAHPNPSEEAGVSEMSRNLCRCGSYERIKRATLRAARKMAGTGGTHE